MLHWPVDLGYMDFLRRVGVHHLVPVTFDLRDMTLGEFIITSHLLCWASGGRATNSLPLVLYMGVSHTGRCWHAGGMINSSHSINCYCGSCFVLQICTTLASLDMWTDHEGWVSVDMSFCISDLWPWSFDLELGNVDFVAVTLEVSHWPWKSSQGWCSQHINVTLASLDVWTTHEE